MLFIKKRDALLEGSVAKSVGMGWNQAILTVDGSI